MAAFVDHTRRLKGFVPQGRFKAAREGVAAATAAAAAPQAAEGEAKAAAPPGIEVVGGRRRGRGWGSWRSSRDGSAAYNEAEEYEVPFMPRQALLVHLRLALRARADLLAGSLPCRAAHAQA